MPLIELTTFWAKVTNTCGISAVSDLVFAAPCGLPSILTQPRSQTIPGGATATLSVAANGGDVTWYRGLPPDKANPVGTGAAVVAGPIGTTTTFWGTVTNSCGEIPIRTVAVYVTSANRPNRGRSVRP